ncbi:MAG: hypothetical protein SOZ84_04370 [Treponema sp.]|nr:hypothetical protein [Treponema sp.]
MGRCVYEPCGSCQYREFLSGSGYCEYREDPVYEYIDERTRRREDGIIERLNDYDEWEEISEEESAEYEDFSCDDDDYDDDDDDDDNDDYDDDDDDDWDDDDDDW